MDNQHRDGGNADAAGGREAAGGRALEAAHGPLPRRCRDGSELHYLSAGAGGQIVVVSLPGVRGRLCVVGAAATRAGVLDALAPFL